MFPVPFFIKPWKERNAAIDRGFDRTCSFYLRLAGLYPDLQAGWRYWFFGMYMNFVIVAYVYYITAYLIANVVAIQYMDFELIGMSFCFGSYTYVYGAISYTIMIKRTKIDKLLEIVGNDIYTYRRPVTKEEAIIRETERNIAKDFGRYSFLVLFVIAVIQMLVIPAIHGFKGEYTSIVNGSAPINMYAPFPLWNPVDATTGLSYFILFWCHVCPGSVEFLILHGSCTFYVGVTCILVSDIKLLCHSLKEIYERAMYHYVVKGGEVSKNDENIYENELFQDCLTECLKENAQHHIKIIEFHQLFQNIVSFPIFFIFSGAAVAVSTPPYTLLKIAEMRDTNKVFTSGIIMIGHTFMSLFLLSRYCQFGQLIESESEKIFTSFYDTPWYKANLKFRKVLIIALSNAQTTPQIKSAIIGASVSSATFMDIVKSSYTLLNFLITSAE